MTNRYIKSLVIGTALASLLTLSALATNVGAGTINANSVNLRTEMSTSADIIGSLDANTTVVVTSRDNSEWSKVWFNGAEGYIYSSYINFSETLDFSIGTGTIAGTNVNIRSGSSTETDILGKLNTGDTVEVLGVASNWYKVSTGGTTAYISSDYITLANQTATSVTSTAYSSSSIVNTAYKYMGVPYVWAGTSPSGFDCSGLVYYVFGENGISTNRTAASLYSNGYAVDRTQLQAGDIICFYNSSYSYIGHVGIYIGNNQFIHASSSEGKVTIDSLSSNYYNTHYYGARRITS